jgi:septal ring factor EnvC (AmiA/AmiB activator)
MHEGDVPMKKPMALKLVGFAMMAMVLTSCSSKPSDQELKQLDDLKAEVASLQTQISAAQSEKAALQKSIADKDAQLAQCMKDKDAVQNRVKAQ